MNNVGTNIMIVRECEAISQEELADKLGVSRQTIYKWENGLAAPAIEHLQKITEIFGCTIEILLKKDLTTTDYQYNKLIKKAQLNLEAHSNNFNQIIWEKIHQVVLANADEVGIDKELLATFLANVCDVRAIFELINRIINGLKTQGMSSEIILNILIGFTEKYIK